MIDLLRLKAKIYYIRSITVIKNRCSIITFSFLVTIFSLFSSQDYQDTISTFLINPPANFEHRYIQDVRLKITHYVMQNSAQEQEENPEAHKKSLEFLQKIFKLIIEDDASDADIVVNQAYYHLFFMSYNPDNSPYEKNLLYWGNRYLAWIKERSDEIQYSPERFKIQSCLADIYQELPSNHENNIQALSLLYELNCLHTNYPTMFSGCSIDIIYDIKLNLAQRLYLEADNGKAEFYPYAKNLFLEVLTYSSKNTDPYFCHLAKKSDYYIQEIIKKRKI